MPLSLVVLALLLLVVAASARGDALLRIPAGPFTMGRDAGPPDEAPAHLVVVAGFSIERLKVTNAEFAEFLDARGLVSAEGDRRFDDDDPDARIHRIRLGTPPAPGGGPPVRWTADAGFERHPVVEVSWFGARDYCAWKGRRLPAEAEWEKAARGDDGRPYPWGSAPPRPELAVFGRRYNATEPTDGRPRGASPYGVEDLLGNLREWTATVLKPYPYRGDDGREPYRGTDGRVVVRGASHDDAAAALSVTTRRSYDRRGAAAGHHFVGFRCAG